MESVREQIERAYTLPALSTSVTEIGIGFARDSAGRPYYVQVFGKPR